MNEEKEFFCEKCGTKMERVERWQTRSFDMAFSFTNSSTAASVTVDRLPIQSSMEKTRSIRIVKYVCPNCGWENQVIE